MAVAVMGGAQQPEIAGLGTAAERERQDVIDLQPMPGAGSGVRCPGPRSCSNLDRAPGPAA